MNMNKEDLCFMPAWEIAEAIKRQDLTAVEITEKFIERIEKVNPLINAYCVTTFDMAREQAKKADDAVKKGEKTGLLHGIPTSIKDLIELKGVKTTFGSKIHEDYVPEVDEVVITRLKDAGAVILGKTNTPEFGHEFRTTNLVYGTTFNPWNLEKTCGGSSGGAAAAAASGISPLALGSDGGGSIRTPSSFCGLFGLKPTFGRIPRFPRQSHAWITLDHYGPITRYVKDAALMLDVMQGNHDADMYSIQKTVDSHFQLVDEKPKKLKIGYTLSLSFVKALDPEVREAVLNSVSKFEKFDWDVEEAVFKLRNADMQYSTLVSTGYAYDLKKHLKKWRDQMMPNLISFIEAGKTQTAMELEKADHHRRKVFEILYKVLQEYDILICPTTPIPAFDAEMKYPETIGGRSASVLTFIGFLYPFNITGLPAANIPCGWSSDGLPIGMQIVGKRFDELTILQVSKAFEEVAPWQDKRPPLN